MSRGAESFHNGLAAESIAARHYEALGGRVLAQRWKMRSGEIDLIIDLEDVLVFVEVKARKTLEAAVFALRPAQQARLISAAESYLAQHSTLNAPCRFDLVAVDSAGRIEVLKNIMAG
ncbi:MAG: YraN family protein [Rhodobacteraceae bacterium]|nr:YraN family protein [Paracoccaceae bacterium]